MERFCKTLLVSVAFAMLFAVPDVLLAQETDLFSLTPAVVHEKAKAREILKQSLTLTNNSSRPLNIYASVNNIDISDGLQEFKVLTNADLSASLANWIEITRGVIEIAPGETKQIPYLVHVNLRAQPGLYHARISFAEGTNRADAENGSLKRDMSISVEVLDDAKEHMELATFSPDKPFFSGGEATFSFSIDNVGNRALSPEGEVRIYNRKGEEVGTLPVNEDGSLIEPNTSSDLALAWESIRKLGKYKAFLDVQYGNTQRANVQDTVYFWIFPWKEILVIFILLAIAVTLGTLYLHNKYLRKPHAHAAVLAQQHTPAEERMSEPEPESVAVATVKKPKRSLFKSRKKTKEAAVDSQPADDHVSRDLPQKTDVSSGKASKQGYSVSLSKPTVLKKTARQTRPGAAHVVSLKPRGRS